MNHPHLEKKIIKIIMIRIAYYSLKLKDPEDLKKGVTKQNIPEA